MKIFISWSGERSKVVAHALRDWLPLVLHYVDPWLSEADVSAGDRWAQELSKELEVSNFGIICVTPENIDSPWILFEAGALAKSMQGAKVIPLLFNLEFSDISGPLAQFQAKKISRAGLEEMIHSINHATDANVPDERAKQLFGALWPEFENNLQSIPTEAPTEKHKRPQHEIIEELVTGVRGLDTRLGDLASAYMEGNPRPARHRMRRFHPMLFEDLSHMLSEEKNDPILILVWASMIREDLPWLYEIMIEAYREMKIGDAKSRAITAQRLYGVFRSLHRGPIMEMIDSKEMHMMMREMPHLLERYLDRMRLDEGPEPEEPSS